MSRTCEPVDWKELKKTLGVSYKKSPLPVLEEDIKIKKLCKKLTLHGFEMLIDANTKFDAIYLVLEGTIGIGNTISKGGQDYLVQNLIVNPFSFIGEIEAPMEIDGYVFPQLVPQLSAWVSTQTLALTMAVGTASIKSNIYDGDKAGTNTILKQFLNEGLLNKNDFVIRKEEQKKYITEGNRNEAKDAEEFLNLFSKNYPRIVEILLPSEKEIFSRKAKAVLLEIPFVDGNANRFWENKKLKKLLCEDLFKRSKKYWLGSSKRELHKIISDLYRHAQLNDMLVDDALYLLDNFRVQAITDSSLIARGKKKIELRKKLKSEGFDLEVIKVQINDMSIKRQEIIRELEAATSVKSPKKDNNEKHLKNMQKRKALYDAICLNILGQGGNKEIFKVERVRNA